MCGFGIVIRGGSLRCENDPRDKAVVEKVERWEEKMREEDVEGEEVGSRCRGKCVRFGEGACVPGGGVLAGVWEMLICFCIGGGEASELAEDAVEDLKGRRGLQ